MTKTEWLKFLESKGKSLQGKRCKVPVRFLGGMYKHDDIPRECATIVKLTKSTMVGVVTPWEPHNIKSFPYDLVELVEEKK